MSIGSEIFFCDNSIYLGIRNYCNMIVLISTEIGSSTIDLVFESMESRTQVRQCKKVLAYIYMSNLEVLDLIEHIN